MRSIFKVTRFEFIGFMFMCIWLVRYLVEPFSDWDLFIVGAIIVIVSNSIDIYKAVNPRIRKQKKAYIVLYTTQATEVKTDDKDYIPEQFEHTKILSSYSVEELGRNNNVAKALRESNINYNQILGIIFLGNITRIKS